MPQIIVLKANGEKEYFDIVKVAKSLQRSGASKQDIKTVLQQLIPKLYNNISTHEIYKIVHSLLYKNTNTQGVASKYNLKKAIFDLGPSGYPFEKFLAGIFNSMGYTTKTNIIAKGKCVSHEIDVIANKGSQNIYIEAKFHGRQGFKTNIKTALYVFARYLDIAETHKNVEYYLITNTKVTNEVIKYSLCSGLKVISWDYPNNNSLRNLVDKSNLHPITILASIPEITKKHLLNNGVIFYEDLKNNKSLISQKEYNSAISEYEKMYNKII